MKKIFIFLCLLVFFGCHSNPKQLNECESGPLARLSHFEVIPLFLLNEDNVNDQCLLKIMEETFQKIGLVKPSTSHWLLTANPNSSFLCFVIKNVGNAIQIDLRVLAEVEIKQNKCQTGCTIWEKNIHIAHVLDKIELNTKITIAAKELMEFFVKEYQEANSDKTVKPLFTIQNPIL